MIEFDEMVTYGDSAFGLKCPNCGGSNLHQVAVDVFARAEDSPSTRVHVNNYTGDISKTTGHLADFSNPSLRRQAAVITFTCEQCFTGDPSGDSVRNIDFHLQIFQHKGTTYIEWGDKINVG